MDIFAEDGPVYKGNVGDTSQTEELAHARKEQYMRHFMVDFIDISMRRIAYDNSIHCAQRVGYFNDSKNVNQRKLDADYEKCLGKYSDSYESGLDILTQHLALMNKSKLITHGQELKGKSARDNSYLMGGETAEPIYDNAQTLPGLDLKVKNDLIDSRRENKSF